MKKLLIIIALSLPLTSHAGVATWNATSTNVGFISPTAINGNIPFVQAPSFTATSTTVASTFPYASTTIFSSSGTTYLSTTSGNVGIATSSPFALLSIVGRNLNTIFLGNGIDADTALYVVGGTGQGVISAGFNGGKGGPLYLLGGVGGSVGGGNPSDTGGAGGAVSIYGGIGASVSNNNATAGAGGTTTISGGMGGQGVNGFSGAGGDLNLLGGIALDAGNDGEGDSGGGGKGGSVLIKAAKGGNASAISGATNGNGGNVIIKSGIKGTFSGLPDGKDGNIQLLNGNVGVGTTSPYSLLSVAGQVVGQYFTATSTTLSSIFPYASTTMISATTASTTNLYISSVGENTAGTFLAADKNGMVIATNTPSGGSGTVTSITASSPLTGGTITTSGSIGCQLATTVQAGCLSSTDWNTFNNKGNGIGTVSTSSIPTIGNLAYWTSNGYPSLLGTVATSSETCTSPLSCTAFSVVGSGGAVSLGTVGVVNGGTGATTFGQGWIYSNGGTNILNSSTSPTVNYLVATSTKVASIFPYASTTMVSATTASTTNLYVSSVGENGAGTFLAADPSGKVIATTTPSGGTGSPGGSNTQIQYNNSGSFGGLSNFVNSSGNPQISKGGQLLYNGINALFASSTIDDLFFGNGAGNAPNVTNGSTGQNIAIGEGALGALTTGFQNGAYGHNALQSCQSCSANFAIAPYSLTGLVSGTNNVALGVGSMQNGGNAVTNNTFIGTAAGQNGTGSNNTGVGYNAIQGGNQSGSLNTAVGSASLLKLTSGQRDIGIGANVGSYGSVGNTGLQIGNDDIFIGYQTWLTQTDSGINNAIVLGSNTEAVNSNTAIIGGNPYNTNGGDGSVNTGLGTSTPIAKLDIVQKSNSGTPFLVVATSTSKSVVQTIDKIDANGLLGLGTSTPWLALSVEGDSTLGNSATAGFFTATSTTATSTFKGGIVGTGYQDVFGTTTGTNFSNAKALFMHDDIGGALISPHDIGGIGEAKSDGTHEGRGLYGIGITNGSGNSEGFYGYATTSATGDTGSADGAYGSSQAIHSGGINTGVLGIASGSTYENYGVSGNATAPSSVASFLTIGTYGAGTTNNSNPAAGLYGLANVTNSSDTGGAYGAKLQSTATHAGGINYGVYSDASGGASNYSFYGNTGTFYNAGNSGFGTSNPTAILDVVGSPIFQGATGNGDFQVWTADGTTGKWDFATESTQNGRFTFYDQVNNKNPFYIETNTPTNTFYIKNSGDVGIGTSSPKSAFVVGSGDIFVGTTTGQVSGVILEASDASCHKIVVSSVNVITASTVTCPF